jgi:hypothetical protein
MVFHPNNVLKKKKGGNQTSFLTRRLELRVHAVQVKNIFDLLDKLRSRELTGNKAIASVNFFISFNRKYREIIHCFLDKSFKIRINVTSINKIFSEMVPDFSVALAEKWHEVKPDIENEEWYIFKDFL